MSEYIVRFLVGGAAVSALATLGDILRPKSFAGLFGAAPSVALARCACAQQPGTLPAHAGFVLDALEQALHDRRPIHRGGSCTTATGAANTYPLSTPNAWQKLVSSLRSAVSEIPMIMLSPKPSTAFTRPRIHRRGPWRSFEPVEFATLEWVDWFNNRRLLEPIGNIPPAEAEQRYYAMLEQPAMAA